MSEDNKKLEVLEWVKENKVKTALAVAIIFLIVVYKVGNHKKEDTNTKDEKVTSYISKDNEEEFYKEKYFRQIDPKLKTQGEELKDIKDQLASVLKSNEHLKKQVIDATKGYQNPDIFKNDNIAIPGNIDSRFVRNGFGNGYGDDTPKSLPKPTKRVVEWSVKPNVGDLTLRPQEDQSSVGGKTDKSQTTGNNKKKPVVIIPSGSLILVKLDNGMHLSTLNVGNSSLTPVTATLVSDVFLPNGRTFDMQGAKMVLEGEGSLSTERGYVRTKRISGFNSSNQVFDLPIEGYLSDVRAGIQGIQGTIISKQEKLFWSSLVAYTIQGFGKGLATANTTTAVSALGTTSTVDPGKAFENGLLDGVAGGAQNVGDEILKIAKNIEPIVEVLGQQYAIVHTTMPFELFYKIDSGDNMDAPANDTSMSSINNIIKAGK